MFLYSSQLGNTWERNFQFLLRKLFWSTRANFKNWVCCFYRKPWVLHWKCFLLLLASSGGSTWS